ncbi:hypothetical protein LTR17_001583 [Elasticomyces elasticus]|nr:hypothetical protein LTR17_001583 [Elasticomyces elasticus]
MQQSQSAYESLCQCNKTYQYQSSTQRAWEETTAFNADRLCLGCESLDLAGAFWQGRAFFIDSSEHSGLASLEALQDSAQGCPFCKLLFNKLDFWWDMLEGDGPEWEKCKVWPVFMSTIIEDAGFFLKVGVNTLSEGESRYHNDYWLVKLRLSIPKACGVAAPWDSQCKTDYTLDVHDNHNNALRQISKWIRQCDQHAECNVQPWPHRLPRRLLDIGTTTTPLLRLIEVVNVQHTYAALSYCWGSGSNIKTTSAVYESFRSHIDETQLPKTIAEAIQLCRSLDIGYCWVDALCIVQDDAEDWNRESAIAGAIYEGSHLTICVASAAEASKGFLHEQIPLSTRCGTSKDPPHHPIVATDYHGEYERRYNTKEPLEERGWALQERVLSRRKVVFKKNQLWWECCRGAVADHSPETIYPLSEGTLEERRMWYQAPHNIWRNLVEEYSGTALSRATDRLPAFTGISRAIGVITGDRYIAGHWISQLPRDLLWQKSRPERADRARWPGPTWSWASAGSKISFNHDSNYATIIAKLKCHSLPPAENEMYGDAKGAWLKLSARCFELSALGTMRSLQFDRDYEMARFNDDIHLAITLDYKGLDSQPFFCILSTTEANSLMPYKVCGLLIAPADVGHRRLGFFELWGKVQEFVGNQAFRTVTLT